MRGKDFSVSQPVKLGKREGRGRGMRVRQTESLPHRFGKPPFTSRLFFATR